MNAFTIISTFSFSSLYVECKDEIFLSLFKNIACDVDIYDIHIPFNSENIDKILSILKDPASSKLIYDIFFSNVNVKYLYFSYLFKDFVKQGGNIVGFEFYCSYNLKDEKLDNIIEDQKRSFSEKIINATHSLNEKERHKIKNLTHPDFISFVDDFSIFQDKLCCSVNVKLFIRANHSEISHFIKCLTDDKFFVSCKSSYIDRGFFVGIKFKTIKNISNIVKE